MLLWLLPSLMAFGQDYVIDTNNGSVTITGYNGEGGAVSIPGTISGLPVTAIGNTAFAFAPLTSLSMPTTVTNIGEAAFLLCNTLTNITLSAGVVSLGDQPFEHCTALKTINVDPANPMFNSTGGVLFNKNFTTLVQYPEGKGGGSYVISNTVKTVGNGAFYSCAGLTNIVAPAGLTNVADFAFDFCGGLTAFTIPAGVINIGDEAFYSCTNLASITIPDGVKSLGFQACCLCPHLTNAVVGAAYVSYNAFGNDGQLATVMLRNSVTSVDYRAFQNCTQLTSVSFGNSLTNLGDSAFAYCFDLANVTLPASLTLLNGHVFEYCSSLTNIFIPASVTGIGDAVFEFCANLTNITVDAANPAYASASGVLFDKAMARLIQYPENRAGHTYTVPAGVTSIGDTAFAFGYNLGAVTIPASVTNIETLAFYDCVNISGLFFVGNPPGLQNYAFNLVNNGTVYYLPGSTGWPASYGGLPTVLWNPQTSAVQAGPTSQSGVLGFEINGTAGLPLVIDATTNVVTGPWTTVQTCTLTNGWIYFSDPQSPSYPARYYRIRSP